MEQPSYLITTGEGTGEIVEKKSRFIADVFPVRDTEEAEARIAEIRKKYWDARHHCYAFSVGSRGENTRCSDDGEPSGTAGKPILEVLTGAGLTDTLIIVTRYFGGTLLGTGGLVRAYTQAAQAGLRNTPRAEMVYGNKISIDIDYTYVTPLQRYLREHNIITSDIQYGEKVTAQIHIIASDIESFRNAITQMTDGRATITQGPAEYFQRPAAPDGGESVS